MRNKSQFWILIFLTTVFLMVGVSVAAGAAALQTEPATFAPFSSPTSQPVCPPSCDHIFAAAPGDFIVKLKTDNYQPETKLDNKQIQIQRQKLKLIQSGIRDLIASKRKENSETRVRFYFEATPYILINVDSDILRELIHHPAISAIYISSPMNEVFGMGLESAVIDLDAIYGKSLPLYERAKEKCVPLTCNDLNAKAQKQGFIDLVVVLTLPKQPQYKGTNPDFQRAQNAVIRQAQISFLRKILPNLISIESLTVQQSTLQIRLQGNSFKKLIDIPEVDFVMDPYEFQSHHGKLVPRFDTLPTTPTTPNYNLLQIGAEVAWSLGIEGSNQKILILDTGVDKLHPAFQQNGTSRVLDGRCQISGGGCYDPAVYPILPDTSNYAAPCYPISTQPPTPTPTFTPTPDYDCSHGTHMGSIAAANYNQNGTVVYGLARKAQIFPMRSGPSLYDVSQLLNRADEILGTSPNAFSAVALSGGFDYPGRNGYTNANECDADALWRISYKEPADLLQGKNVPVFAATGNEGQIDRVSPPACISTIISVAAGEPNSSLTITPFYQYEQLQDYTNSYWDLDLVVPDQSYVASVSTPGSFSVQVGTSLSSPIAAAAWILLREKYPNATYDELLHILLSSGIPANTRRKYITPTSTIIPTGTRTIIPTNTINPSFSPTPNTTYISPPQYFSQRLNVGGMMSTVTWKVSHEDDYPKPTSTPTNLSATATPMETYRADRLFTCVPFPPGLSNRCTLRDAINVAKPGDVIEFNLPAEIQTIELTETLIIPHGITIKGPTGSNLTIRYNSSSNPALKVENPSTTLPFTQLKISNITLKNSLGEALKVVNVPQADIILENVRISDSNTTAGSDAPLNVENAKSLQLNGVVFEGNKGKKAGAFITSNVPLVQYMNGVVRGNTVTDSGYGVINNPSGKTLTLENVEITDNVLTNGHYGAGIYNLGTLNVSNSTFGNNQVNLTITGTPTCSTTTLSSAGGAIYNDGGTVTLNNTTIADNRAHCGGGLANKSGSVTLKNTVLSSNGLSGMSHKNCYGTGITAGNYNIEYPDPEGGPVCNANIRPTASPLSAIKYVGSTTMRAYPLSTESAAIDSGNDATCQPYDQIGTTRPVGGHCDIGAIEYTTDYRFMVTTTAMRDSGVCRQNDCSIIEAVKYAPVNAIITFSPELPTTNGKVVFKLEQPLFADRPLTIQGKLPGPNTIVLDGQNKTPILRLVKCVTCGYVNMPFTIKNVNFVNGACNAPLAPEIQCDGGAVYARGFKLIAEDLLFMGNDAFYTAGLSIYYGQGSEVRRSTFIKNVGHNTRGAAFNFDGSGSEGGLIFENNTVAFNWETDVLNDVSAVTRDFGGYPIVRNNLFLANGVPLGATNNQNGQYNNDRLFEFVDGFYNNIVLHAPNVTSPPGGYQRPRVCAGSGSPTFAANQNIEFPERSEVTACMSLARHENPKLILPAGFDWNNPDIDALFDFTQGATPILRFEDDSPARGSGSNCPTTDQRGWSRLSGCDMGPLAFAMRQNNPDTVGLYYNGTFYLNYANDSSAADVTLGFGNPGDLPVTGDWDGDGTDTVGVFRRNTGEFFLRVHCNVSLTPSLAGTNTPTPTPRPCDPLTNDIRVVYGNPGDYPIAGRWDKSMNFDSLGVFRESNGVQFYLRRSLTESPYDPGNGQLYDNTFLIFGDPGDRPIVGDWDNDGTDSIGIYRPSSSLFYLRPSIADAPTAGPGTSTPPTSVPVYVMPFYTSVPVETLTPTPTGTRTITPTAIVYYPVAGRWMPSTRIPTTTATKDPTITPTVTPAYITDVGVFAPDQMYFILQGQLLHPGNNDQLIPYTSFTFGNTSWAVTSTPYTPTGTPSGTPVVVYPYSVYPVFGNWLPPTSTSIPDMPHPPNIIVYPVTPTQHKNDNVGGGD